VSVFCWPARVYWEDTDGGAVVYYANYLRFLERARTEWLRRLGASQLDLAREPGILFAVVSIQVDYHAPARLDDELEITCEPRRQGAASLLFAQCIYRTPARRAAGAARDHRALVEARVRVACVDAASFKPRRLPQFLLDAAGPETSRG
jgi:acyl-CoA thioester hydrolase